MIELKELASKKEMREFVKFPFKLYKGNPYWVPPIIKDELASLDKNVNPVFKHAETRFFLAYKNNEIVGRIAIIINTKEVNEQQIRKIRFGWFDVIDDISVTKVLLDKANEIGKQNNLEFIEGPMGFTNLDKVGVLIEGFDHIGTMITWYNHPYYKDHFEELGFVKSKEYLENIVEFKNINPNKFSKVATLVSKRYNLRTLNFTKSSQIMPYVDKMFDLFNESYANLASFTPISEAQREFFKKKYISFIDPEFIKFVVDENNTLKAFAITLPSFSRALQKAKGTLFPFGLFHLLKAKNNPKEVILYLIGVHPTLIGKGIPALIMNDYYKVYAAKGIKKLVRTPELEENETARRIWKDFNSVTHKRRRTYKKDIG